MPSQDTPWRNGRLVKQQSAIAFLGTAALIILCALLIKKSLNAQQKILRLSDTSYRQQLLLARISKEVTFVLKNAPLLDKKNTRSISEQLLIDMRSGIKDALIEIKINNERITDLIHAESQTSWLHALQEFHIESSSLDDYNAQLKAFRKRIYGLMNSDLSLIRAGLENWQPAFVFVARENMLIDWLSELNQQLHRETLKKNKQIMVMCAVLLVLILLGLYVIWESIFHPLSKRLEVQADTLKCSHQRLHDLAYVDELSGLPNRKAFAAHCETLCNETLALGKVGLIAMDIDCFKTINDSFGHSSGDQILRETGTLLSSLSTSSVQAYRLGGDEFVILIKKQASHIYLEHLSQKILQGFRENIRLPNTQVSFSCSLGVAISHPAQRNIEDLLSAADFALYKVKEELGGDNFLFINDSSTLAASKALSVERELRFAVEKEEFHPYFEPIVDLRTHRILGFEALARWQHPSKGVLSPAHWIQEAERLKLLSKITTQILQKTAMAHQVLEAEINYPFWININVTASLLMTGSVLEFVQNQFHKSYPAAPWFGLEITESIILDRNYSQILEQLNLVRQLGVKIFLDDFGTGFASLSHLKKIPFDTIKVDKSFVTHLNQSKDNKIIVQAMLKLAHDLGKNTVCEGIEQHAVAEQLRNLGGNWGQGHLYGKPLSLTSLQNHLRGKKHSERENFDVFYSKNIHNYASRFTH